MSTIGFLEVEICRMDKKVSVAEPTTFQLEVKLRCALRYFNKPFFKNIYLTETEESRGEPLTQISVRNLAVLSRVKSAGLLRIETSHQHVVSDSIIQRFDDKDFSGLGSNPKIMNDFFSSEQVELCGIPLVLLSDIHSREEVRRSEVVRNEEGVHFLIEHPVTVALLAVMPVIHDTDEHPGCRA